MTGRDEGSGHLLMSFFDYSVKAVRGKKALYQFSLSELPGLIILILLEASVFVSLQL